MKWMNSILLGINGEFKSKEGAVLAWVGKTMNFRHF